MARPNTNKEYKSICVSDMSFHNLFAHLRLWSVAMVGLIADLLTKRWAMTHLIDETGREKPMAIIENYFYFILGQNAGGPWSIAEGKTGFLIGGSLMALVFLLWIFSTSHYKHWVCHIALGMLLAGALGNLYDRIFNDGKVVDFISVDLHVRFANPWPTFNIADVLLTVGVGILMIHLFRHSDGQAVKQNGKADEDS